MNDNQPQNLDNHRRLITLWHLITAPVIIVLAVYNLYLVFTDFSFATLMGLASPLVLASIWVYARIFAITVQDRVIRLEERLRLARILPEELRTRIAEITTSQLIGLRFAQDDEAVELSRRILSGDLADQKEIKKSIKNWRADNERA
jgi:hypothetical protein